MLDATFVEGVDASKRRWHEPSVQQKGITAVYRWTGPGRDGLEVAYGNADSRPNVTTVREVWKQRHGHRAAPLLLVVDYSEGGRSRAPDKVSGLAPEYTEIAERKIKEINAAYEQLNPKR